MVVSFIILAVSLAMFVYWFRYSCVLILESDWNEEQAHGIAYQNNLSFNTVEERLAVVRSSAVELDQVRDALDRDLEQIRSLMAACESLREAGPSLENRMLLMHFQIMRGWYALSRSLVRSGTPNTKAHGALREMSRVVAYMAGELGDHMATAQL